MSDTDTNTPKRPRIDRRHEPPEQRLERLREYKRTFMRLRRGTPGALDAPPRPYVRREITAEELAAPPAPPGARRQRRGSRTPTERWLAKLRKLTDMASRCEARAEKYAQQNERERVEHRRQMEAYAQAAFRLTPEERSRTHPPTLLPPMEETPEELHARLTAQAALAAHAALHPDLAEEYDARRDLHAKELKYHRALSRLNSRLTRRITRINDAYRDPVTGLDPLAQPLPPGHPDAPPDAPPTAPAATAAPAALDEHGLPPLPDDDDDVLPEGVTQGRARRLPTATLTRLTAQHARLLKLRRQLTQEHEEELERPARSLAERNRLQLRLDSVRRREEEVYTRLERVRWRVKALQDLDKTTQSPLQDMQWDLVIARDNVERFKRENTHLLPNPPRAPLFPPRNARALDDLLTARQRARDYEAEAYPVSNELFGWAMYAYSFGYTDGRTIPYLRRNKTGRRVKATTVLIENRANGRQTRVLAAELLAKFLNKRPSPPTVTQVPRL